MELNFRGKHVMVVGGTSGINLGIALIFAAQSAKVSVVSRSEQKVKDAQQALREAGASEVFGFVSDVRDPETLGNGFQSCCAAMGNIDVLVSGAAGNFPAMAKDMSPNAFKSVIDIDVLGSFNVLHLAYDYLTKPGASVINISAPQATTAMQGQSHVCAAKAGVDMLTRSLALEWAEQGIRVNAVSPGPIDGTEGMRRLAPNEAFRKACVDSVPLKRFGQPEDIGHMCLFLSSEMASYVTGQVISVDGGWNLGGAASLGMAMSKLLTQAKPTDN